MKRSERTFIKHLFGAKISKNIKGNHPLKDKQDLSAGNHSLRLPALRPCLLGMFLINKNISKIHRGIIFPSNVKPKNRRTIISALTTISIILPTIITFTTSKSVSAASLTLTIPDSISVSINTQNSVTYKESDKSNITIKTDAYAGYTLNIKSTDGTNVLRTTDGKTINSIESPLDDYQTSGATNTWAFLPGKLNSTENSQYQPGPKVDLLLGRSSGSNSEPEVYPISIATKIDGNQPTGTYKNSFTITATANPVPYEITYDYNNGSGNISPNPQTGTGVEGSTIKLSDETPTRSNYEFLGWCDASTDNEQCSGNKYEKGGNYTLKNSDNKFTLRAIWKEKSDGDMQSWNGCNQLTQDNGSNGNGIRITLTDTRDGNNYKIAKLKDGKCWMVEDLRIAGKSIDSSNSNTNSSFTIPNSASNFTGTNNNAAYYDPVQNSSYYSWFTATAGTGTYSMSSNSTASSSICPKGWKLPSGGPNGEFNAMSVAYSNNNSLLMKSPVPNFALNGAYYSNSLDDRNSYGWYWSSMAYNNSFAYRLSINKSVVIPGDSRNKEYGFSVRCIKKDEGTCFVPGTMVDTLNGLISIENITKGMKVYSYDFDSNIIKEDIVVDTFIRTVNSTIKFTFEDGSTIEGTEEHPFYDLANKQWKNLGEFKIGDILQTIDGSSAIIKNIEIISGDKKVYNFKTQNYHNYFIMDSNSNKRYLVHNAAYID